MPNPAFSARVTSKLYDSNDYANRTGPSPRAVELTPTLTLLLTRAHDIPRTREHASTSKTQWKRSKNPGHSSEDGRCPRRAPRAARARMCPQPSQTGGPAPARFPPEPSTRPTAALPPAAPPSPTPCWAAESPSRRSAPMLVATLLAVLDHDNRRAPSARARPSTSFCICQAGLSLRESTCRRREVGVRSRRVGCARSTGAA